MQRHSKALCGAKRHCEAVQTKSSEVSLAGATHVVVDRLLDAYPLVVTVPFLIYHDDTLLYIFYRWVWAPELKI